MNRKLVLYIATSLDGYIAKPDDNLDFLALVEKEGEDYGYNDFVKTVDTVIVGRKTFEKVAYMGCENPHPDKTTYVISRRQQPDVKNIKFFSGNLTALVSKLKAENGKNIYCDGGAEIVNELLKQNLIDELIISIIPILLGSGTKLFKEFYEEQKLVLLSAKHFEKGLVQLHYKRQE